MEYPFFQGDPFKDQKTYGVHGVAMLTQILKKVEELGWKICCSLDLSAKYLFQFSGPDASYDIHSWFLMRGQVQWTDEKSEKDGKSEKGEKSDKDKKSEKGAEARLAPSAPPCENLGFEPLPPPSYEDATCSKY